MDIRLKLTQKQRELVNKFVDTLQEMRENNIGLIADGNSHYHPINLEQVDYIGYMDNPKGYDVVCNILEDEYIISVIDTLKLDFSETEFVVKFK